MKKYEVITSKYVKSNLEFRKVKIFDSKKKAIEYMYQEMEFFKEYFVDENAIEFKPSLPYNIRKQWYSFDKRIEGNSLYLGLDTFKDGVSTEFMMSLLPHYEK